MDTRGKEVKNGPQEHLKKKCIVILECVFCTAKCVLANCVPATLFGSKMCKRIIFGLLC